MYSPAGGVLCCFLLTKLVFFCIQFSEYRIWSTKNVMAYLPREAYLFEYTFLNASVVNERTDISRTRYIPATMRENFIY